MRKSALELALRRIRKKLIDKYPFPSTKSPNMTFYQIKLVHLYYGGVNEMTTVSTATKRDLHADLALCEAAVISEDYYVEDREDEVVIVGNGGIEIAEFYTLTDAEFYCESRGGWPEAIRRAIAAEAEVERLREGITRLRDRLICDLDALESGDATERTVAYADCTESIIRRLDRYVPREVPADAPR